MPVILSWHHVQTLYRDEVTHRCEIEGEFIYSGGRERNHSFDSPESRS